MIKNLYYNEQLLLVKRTCKTVKGGRVLSFAALVAIGNKTNLLGIGYGKGRDIIGAIKKATYIAKKNVYSLQKLKLVVKQNQPLKYKATKIIIKPNIVGIFSQSALNTIFSLIGVSGICTKIYGSRNTINVINTILKKLKNV